MPMMPPPPPPPPSFDQLAQQRVARKNGLKAHKQTVMEFQTVLEGTVTTPSPDEPIERQPTSLAELCTPPSDSSECAGIATAVLEASGEHDPIEDGFAALRAQSAARKKHLRELKRSTAHVSAACDRTNSSRYTRKIAPPSESV